MLRMSLAPDSGCNRPVIHKALCVRCQAPIVFGSEVQPWEQKGFTHVIHNQMGRLTHRYAMRLANTKRYGLYYKSLLLTALCANGPLRLTPAEKVERSVGYGLEAIAGINRVCKAEGAVSSNSTQRYAVE